MVFHLSEFSLKLCSVSSFKLMGISEAFELSISFLWIKVVERERRCTLMPRERSDRRDSYRLQTGVIGDAIQDQVFLRCVCDLIAYGAILIVADLDSMVLMSWRMWPMLEHIIPTISRGFCWKLLQ